jgi:hypothetical protein
MIYGDQKFDTIFCYCLRVYRVARYDRRITLSVSLNGKEKLCR